MDESGSYFSLALGAGFMGQIEEKIEFALLMAFS